MEDENNISMFFDRKTILITGVTGFVGKVLIEKLLRCCPGINKVYLLVRPKKGKHVKERINDMFSEELFQKLKYQQPNYREKVCTIEADMSQLSLGLSEEDRLRIIATTQVVIHCAASVKFDEPIRTALYMNVRAVKEIIKLCKEMDQIQVLCHVSTAYSNCNQKDEIKESIYPVSTEPQNLLDIAEWMSDDALTVLTPTLIGKYPNTYTFTKGLAEHIIQQELQGIPCCIVRPSIITSAFTDPLPGWVDNFNVTNGFMLAIGRGYIQTVECNWRYIANLVPVDYVSNGIIVATYTTALERPMTVTTYNCTPVKSNAFIWDQFRDVAFRKMIECPFEDSFRIPSFSFSGSRLSHLYKTCIAHWIPAVFIDLLSMLTGSKPQLCKLYKRMNRSMNVFRPLVGTNWTWEVSNLPLACNKLSTADRETFNCDMSKINWKEYTEIYVLGTKQFLSKDDMSDLSKAKRQALRCRIIGWISYILFSVLSWRFLMVKSPRFRQLWFQLLSFCYGALRSLNVVSLRHN